MYSEWTSVEAEVQDFNKCKSVLHHYPPSVGRDVAKSVVASLTGGSSSNNGNRTPEATASKPQFHLDSEVKWTMEVVCFGLSLTLMELETLKESVSVYLDWLSVLTIPNATIPEPIRRDPLPYVRQMIHHLQNLFIPRTDGAISAQLSLCQNVLRAVQNVAQNSYLLDRASWETLLMFILNVSDQLLSTPSQTNGLAEQLCDLLMQTLMQVWLLACVRSFPTPPFWKTAQELFAGWRHHPPVIEYWCKITAALTSKVVEVMHGPAYPKMKIPEEDLKFIPSDMTDEVVTQTWYRMLRMINNPIDLCNPTAISSNPRFFETALTRDNLPDPSQHPGLAMLPHIFLRSMRGVSNHVDAFLGMSGQKRSEIVYPYVLTKIANPETPTVMRKSAKGSSRKGVPSTSSLQSKTSSTSIGQKYNTSPGNINPISTSPSSSVDMHPRPAAGRPQVNSVLHLYGRWLFDAALAGVKPDTGSMSRERGGSQSMRSRSSSGVLGSSLNLGPTGGANVGSGPVSQDGTNLAANPLFDSSEFPDSYDAGRSEACGTLCRIFCCKKTGEHILPVYLSRFYLVVSQGLLGESYQVLASIILNSVNLFRIDLPGITCLLPAMLSALETILPDRDLTHFKPYVNVTELRRASVHLLLSLIPLPLHYDNLPIEDIQSLWYREKSSDTEEGGSATSPTAPGRYTFRSLKLRLIHQLIGALQCETDPINAQMILGGMLVALQDSALVESLGAEEDGSYGRDVVQPSENENVVADTAYGLFVQCVYLVSQRLEFWKSELSVSLAALELLGGLAKAKIHIADSGECRRAVRELCRYIVSQCERPPPHHKRELHSMIVAAFHTLTTWLLEHPYLLNDKDCLNEVLEIIELGISGTKSQPGRRESNGMFGPSSGGLLVNGSTSDKPVFKGEKDLNPASMRVLEAAEGALMCVFEHLGAFPSPCSPSSTCSLLNELSIVRHASGTAIDTPSDTSQLDFADAVKQFRYFITHNSVLLGILEQNLGNEEEPVPTVTVLIRSASGRKARAMRFRQTPRSDKQSSHSYLSCPPRPHPDESPGVHHNVRHRTFPEEVDRIPLVKADCSIPMLSEIPNKEQSEKLEKIQRLIDQQKHYDTAVERRIIQCLEQDEEDCSLRMKECVPPQPAQEFQTARLLLSHLNLLTLSSVKQHSHQRLGPDLVMLNRLDPDFPSDLEGLDSIPVRNNDTVFIFYHKAGQTDKQQILENTSAKSSELRPEFTEFVLSLGWPVDLRTHPGWTGVMSTSWQLKHAPSSEDVIDLNEECQGVFCGEKYILYHADVSTETAFIIPTRRPPEPSPPAESYTEIDSSDGIDRKAAMRDKLQLDLSSAHSSSGESPNSPTGPLGGLRLKKGAAANRSGLQQLPDCRVAVVWTESYDGIDEFPLEDLQSEMYTGQESAAMAAASSRKDMLAIFIHPLEDGLFRICVNGQSGAKSGMAIPLVSGTVVSRRALGPAVRMTASNMCHRRRLDSDAYSPPHIKRKHRINELLTRHQRRCTEPDFFTAVFTDKHVPRPTLPGRMLGLRGREV